MSLREPRIGRAASALLAWVALLVLASPAGAGSRDEQLVGAVRGGDLPRAEALLAGNAKQVARQVNKPYGPAKWTLLHGAVADRNSEMVALLLSKGADVNRKGSEGETALHLATGNANDTTTSSRMRILSALLDAGADVGALDHAGVTPLHWAAMNGDVDGARLLVARNADVNLAARVEKWIPLHGAAASGSMELVRLLLDAGSMMNVRDVQGRTPLGVALWQGKTEIADTLKAHGATE